jgi:hypothetical protein
MGEMSKEHAGGSPDVGYEIPISSWDFEAYPVAIEQFNFSELDKPGDFIVEAVHQNRDIEPILKCLVNQVAGIQAATKIAALLTIILEAKQPRMVAHQIIWATGMTLLDGAPITALAKKYGVSKQAFEQGAMRVCEKLNLRPCRNMRDETARKHMSERNYRRTKANV